MSNKTYDLISSFISLINSEEFEATLVSLAQSCDIPLPYARKCMIRILDNQVLASCIDSDNFYDSNDPELSVQEAFLDNPARFCHDLMAGKYDTLTWSMDLKVLGEDEDQILQLSPIEHSTLLNLGESNLRFKNGAIFEKKDNLSNVSKTIRTNQETIQTAIDNRQAITFTYKSSNGEITTPIGYPVSIFTNVSDNWIYCRMSEGYVCRLDRITSLVRILKNHDPAPDDKELPYEDNIWGSYYNKDERPIHVKLRINPGTGNLMQKITNDTRHRNKVCKLYKEGSYFYYEDDIIGIPEFQRWLRGYGSSIQVLEPISLRAAMMETAEKALKNYELAKKWDI